MYTATTCNGPSTFGVETCTRALEPETAYQAFEETVNGNVIFDNSVEEDAKAGARAAETQAVGRGTHCVDRNWG